MQARRLDKVRGGGHTLRAVGATARAKLMQHAG